MDKYVQKVRRWVEEEVPFNTDEIFWIAQGLRVNTSRSLKISSGEQNYTITVRRTEDTERY